MKEALNIKKSTRRQLVYRHEEELSKLDKIGITSIMPAKSNINTSHSYNKPISTNHGIGESIEEPKEET